MAPNQNYPRDGKPLGISLAPPEGVGGLGVFVLAQALPPNPPPLRKTRGEVRKTSSEIQEGDVGKQPDRITQPE